MYSSRLSTPATVRVCATIQKFFVQKSFNAADADGKKFFAQENTFEIAARKTPSGNSLVVRLRMNKLAKLQATLVRNYDSLTH